jgi:hypothetical protein
MRFEFVKVEGFPRVSSIPGETYMLAFGLNPQVNEFKILFDQLHINSTLLEFLMFYVLQRTTEDVAVLSLFYTGFVVCALFAWAYKSQQPHF